MKIKKIEINNYKAFYGLHIFNIDGNNVLIYGENGSGKSSLYYALKDFFQSSREEIDFSKLENIFIPETDKGKGYIKVILIPIKMVMLPIRIIMFHNQPRIHTLQAIQAYAMPSASKDFLPIRTFLRYITLKRTTRLIYSSYWLEESYSTLKMLLLLAQKNWVNYGRTF